MWNEEAENRGNPAKTQTIEGHSVYFPRAMGLAPDERVVRSLADFRVPQPGVSFLPPDIPMVAYQRCRWAQQQLADYMASEGLHAESGWCVMVTSLTTLDRVLLRLRPFHPFEGFRDDPSLFVPLSEREAQSA